MAKVQGNLTEGPILKVLTKLALPIMASAFLATAYNLTDMAWVGKLGANEVAGVGVGGMYLWLASGLSTLSRTGGQVHMGQELGKGNFKKAGEYGKASIVLSIILGILFGIVCILFTDPLIAFFKLSGAEAISAARIYIKIACGLIVFSHVSVVLTGLYTAQGDSKTPLIANAAGLILNMILDPVLILGIGPFPRLEAAGAAIATVMAQFVVVVVMIALLWSKNGQNNLLRQMTFKMPQFSYVKNVVKMGGPTALQATLYCVFSMILSRMVGGFGDDAIAAQRVGEQVESISWNTADGFATAMNAFAAQNYGADKLDRVKKGYNVSAVLVFAWGTLVALAFLIFPEQISGIFFHETGVIDVSKDYLMIIGVGEAFMCLELMAIGAISGMGNTRICSLISIILTGMRLPLAFILSKTALGLNGIWWALTISSISKGIVLHFTFHKECRGK